MEPEWLQLGPGLTFSNQFRTVGRKNKSNRYRGTCVCWKWGDTIKQQVEPKCWKNHPFRSLHSKALKCLRRVCGSPSRPIADHPYFSITLCTSHEHHNICGTYFTALLAVASRAPESGSEELKRCKSHEKNDAKWGKGQRAAYVRMHFSGWLKRLVWHNWV